MAEAKEGDRIKTTGKYIVSLWAWRFFIAVIAIPFAISLGMCKITKMLFPVAILVVCFLTAVVNVNILAIYLGSLAPYVMAQTFTDDLDDFEAILVVALIEISLTAFALGSWFAVNGGCGIGRTVC